MSWLRDRHYDKAPIKEAIIDIQVEHSPSLTLANFENVEIVAAAKAMKNAKR